MSFKDALHVSSASLILKMALPSWTMKLTERTRKADQALNELKVLYPTTYLLYLSWLMYRTAIYDRNGERSQKCGDKGRALRFV